MRFPYKKDCNEMGHPFRYSLFCHQWAQATWPISSGT